MRNYLMSLFLIKTVILFGQVNSFNFEDKDLTDWFSPDISHWNLAGDNPISGDYSLAHTYDNNEAGIDWIGFFHLPINTSGKAISWEFSLRYQYKPSSKNGWAVLLTSNTIPESKELKHAWILGVNYQGNSDELMIWSETDGVINLIGNTNFNWEDSIKDGQPVNLLLNYFEGNKVSLSISYNSDIYEEIGVFEVSSRPDFRLFALQYWYTASYDQGLSIDNIVIDAEYIKDTIPPDIQCVQVLSTHLLEIEFSEMIRIEKNMELCIEGVGCTTVIAGMYEELALKFPGKFFPGSSYEIDLSVIKDLYANPIAQENSKLLFYYAAPYDIIIEEIMADPIPPIELPEEEWIELYNRSKYRIYLTDWTLSVNGRKCSFPQGFIEPEGYIVIGESGLDSVMNNAHVLGINDFPAISNKEAELILQDRSGSLIHSVSFSNLWYNDVNKAEGGWTVEMIEVESPCEGDANWSASDSYSGGTPGVSNSLTNSLKDFYAPELLRAAIDSSGSVILYFSMALDSLSCCSEEFYTITPSMDCINSIIPKWPVLDKIALVNNCDFLSNISYTINLTNDVKACMGLLLETKSAEFMMPVPSQHGDIVINEIMYDPLNGQMEYIELYNMSLKTIELKSYLLQVGDKTPRVIVVEYFPMLPKSFAIICSAYKGIDGGIRFNPANRIILMPYMPALSNEGANIKLLNSDSVLIDEVVYSDDWHHELYNQTQGVSLERISAEVSGMVQSNWHSAAAGYNYQTPAAFNSQSNRNESNNELTINPKIITPNGDGYEDELSICYQLDDPGYMGRIMIFDSKGEHVQTIFNGSLLGTNGCFVYNPGIGRSSNFSTGYFIVYFEAYTAEGKNFSRKKSFLVIRE